MEDVNPDMEEIFKEAADKYPLKTDTADWEAFSKKLHGREKNIKGVIERKWIILFLLLLIPIGLIITQYFKTHQKQIQTVAKVEDKQIESSHPDNSGSIISKTQPGKQVNQEISPILNENFSKDDHNWQMNNNEITDLQKNEAKEEKNVVIASLLKNKVENHDLNNFYFPDNLNTDKMKNKPTIALENGSSQQSKGIHNTNVAAKTNVSKKSSIHINSKEKRFYIGAVIAPEFTSVKFQTVKKIGFNLGILMGYKLTNKFSLEVGATLAHKYYYTNGKYVAPRSIRGDNSTILNVDAFNSITEMPLTVQYTVKNEKNKRFFVSAGCVSYAIHKEQYNYSYKKNGEEKQSRRYYNKATNSWFSNAQVSAGCVYNVNKIGNITIEPYYRIPLKGIGISDVPITSVGINFALTKNLK
jgi:hypothetical protein